MQKSVYGKDSGLDQVTWSGEYSSWQDYVRRVRLAYERTEKKKRTLLGPELRIPPERKSMGGVSGDQP